MRYTWKKTNIGRVDNLGYQLEKIARHMNQNKMSTRYRYLEAAGRFVEYLGKEYKIKKLANIHTRHLETYTRHLLEKEVSSKYIKNELSGIRFIHDQIDNTKHRLQDAKTFNEKLGLASTKDGRADRAWTDREYKLFYEKAVAMDRQPIADIMEIVRVTGLRLDEVSTLRTEDLKKALQVNELDPPNTKGGVPRKIPLSDKAKVIFEGKLQVLGKGEYAFTPISYVKSHKIHQFEKKVQKYIYNHRDKIQDKDRNTTGHNAKDHERGALTMHGLRHTYARNEYNRLINAGRSKYEARKTVSEQLGHGREYVTFIYLGGKE